MRQIELLQYVLDVVDRLQIPYAVVGSYASGVWGEPRMTLDVDMVVLMEETHVAPFVEAFPDRDFYVSQAAVAESVQRAGQFNVIHPSSGNKIDFMVLRLAGETPPEIARRRRISIMPGCDAYFASPEDVILAKLKYYVIGGSEKHLRDIAGIIKRSGDRLDREYIGRAVGKLQAEGIWAELQTQTGSR